jgi:hypothetical protein
MAVKLTMLFTAASNVSNPTATPRRIGGWSESWYQPGNDIPAAIALAQKGTAGGVANRVGIFAARAALLGLGASLVGFRVQTVDPVGPSQSGILNFPGEASVKQDIPQMALLFKIGSDRANFRRLIIRGIPDMYVVEGEFVNSGTNPLQITQFLSSLNDWYFRGRDLSQVAPRILTIAADGTVQTETPHASQPLDMVRVLRTKNSNDDLVGGRFQVNTIGPGSNTLKLTGWTGGTTTGGTIRKDAIVYPRCVITLNEDKRIVTRRVGRAPNQYRGRQSNRGT